VTRSPVVQICDFLAPPQYEALVRHVRQRREQGRSSGTTDPRTRERRYDESIRRSRLIGDVGLVWPLFEDRLVELFPDLCAQLGIPPFEFGSIERQLTMHGDGDFFQRHRDEQQPGTDGSRVLTFVYYFHDEPKRFDGGALRVYDTTVNPRGHTVVTATHTDIEPVANSIVCFSSQTFHEVMPVRVTDPEPGIGRCTLNGWFRAGDLGRPAIPYVDADAMAVIAPRLLPRLTRQGVTRRSTPDPVQRRLAVIHDLWNRAAAAGTAAPQPDGDGDRDGPTLIPTGPFGDDVLAALLPVAEEWAGTPLEPVVASPLRVHGRGQRVPLRVSPPGSDVVTVLLVVEEDLDAPWPFVLDVDGRPVEIEVGAGEMLLYEGAAIPHGRPEPLVGRSCCTMLVHYRPAGWPHDADALVRRALSEGLLDDTGRPTLPSAL